MLEEIVPLDPVHFFAFQIDLHYLKEGKFEKKHLLPELSSFHNDRPFVQLSMGWNEEGIFLLGRVEGAFDQSRFPNIGVGDSLEFFFDTRDVKTTGYATRYCHHFFFLPEPFESDETLIQAGEITRFRSDNAHELCDPNLLKIEATHQKKRCDFKIFIPSECLYGYDPTQFNRLGFTYRLNGILGQKQYFSASDIDFTIENQPSLWASMKLVK